MTHETITAEFFLHVTPEFKRGQLRGIKADRLTQTLKGRVDPGTVALKVNVSLPRALFDPYIPEVDIEISPDLIESHVEAGSVPVLEEDQEVVS